MHSSAGSPALCLNRLIVGKVQRTVEAGLHTHTVLAHLVSNSWQEDPSKLVFIDRDGGTFWLVLNYFRYGSITS